MTISKMLGATMIAGALVTGDAAAAIPSAAASGTQSTDGGGQAGSSHPGSAPGTSQR